MTAILRCGMIPRITPVAVHALAVGLDGRLYAGAADGTVSVWNSKTGTLLALLTTGDGLAVNALAVSCGGDIYVGGEFRSISVWCGTSGEYLRALEGHPDAVTIITVGLRGKVYSAAVSERIFVWSRESGARIGTLSRADRSSVFSLAVGADGNVYGALNSSQYIEGSSVEVWSGSTEEHLLTLSTGRGGNRKDPWGWGQVVHISIRPDVGTVYCVDSGGHLTVYYPSKRTFNRQSYFSTGRDSRVLMTDAQGHLLGTTDSGHTIQW